MVTFILWVKEDQAEDLSVDGRIILKWILGKQSGKARNEFIWLSMGPAGGLL
jgi:hypothetical protein